MASFATSVYYIRPQDLREDLIRAILTADESRVLLVFPSRMRVRLSGLDLVLIRRQAERSGRGVAVATRSPMIGSLASDAGYPVYPTAARARRQEWPQAALPRTPLAFPAFHAAGLPVDLPPRPRQFPTIYNRAVWEWAVFALSVFSLVVLIVFLFSRAEVVLIPQTRTQTLEITFIGDPTVIQADLGGSLPVNEMNVILDGEFQSESTGRMALPDAHATGDVRLTNLGDDILDVPAGTIVRTLGNPPIQFQTLEPIALPPGEDQAVLTAVEAILAGEDGNVAAGTIVAVSGIMGAELSVTNPEPTRGGTIRRVSTPTQADVELARAELLSNLAGLAQASFSDLETGYDFLLPATIRVDEIIAEELLPTPGEIAESFYLSARVRFTAWVVSTREVEGVAQQLLDANLAAGEEAVPGSLVILPVDDPLVEDESVTWTLTLQQQVREAIDPVFVKEFTSRLGSRMGDWLVDTYELVREPSIQHAPAWWPWMPPFPGRIVVVIQ
ncbi:MAG: baseplate J/gp47 family protein [Anaerolineae bacterium]|nr:baseplate J/gp47 family protein [Anaerolineae bacterium]